MTTFVSFSRRQNDDSTIDSICTRCYQTVASGDRSTELGLVSAEQNHVCNPHGEFNYSDWEHSDRAA